MQFEALDNNFKFRNFIDLKCNRLLRAVQRKDIEGNLFINKKYLL